MGSRVWTPDRLGTSTFEVRAHDVVYRFRPCVRYARTGQQGRMRLLARGAGILSAASRSQLPASQLPVSRGGGHASTDSPPPKRLMSISPPYGTAFALQF